MVGFTLPGDEVPEADLIAQHPLVEDTADDTAPTAPPVCFHP